MTCGALRLTLSRPLTLPMAKFITDLDARELTRDTSTDKRGTRRLLAPLVYESDIMDGKWITVPQGFVTDYASVPRIPVTYLLAGGCANAAAERPASARPAAIIEILAMVFIRKYPGSAGSTSSPRHRADRPPPASR